MSNKKGVSSGILAPILTVAGFWILIKYVLIGGALSTLILFGNPLFWVALILIYVGLSR